MKKLKNTGKEVMIRLLSFSWVGKLICKILLNHSKKLFKQNLLKYGQEENKLMKWN